MRETVKQFVIIVLIVICEMIYQLICVRLFTLTWTLMTTGEFMVVAGIILLFRKRLPRIYQTWLEQEDHEWDLVYAICVLGVIATLIMDKKLIHMLK